MTNFISESAPPAWRRWLAYITLALMPLSVNYERLVGVRKSPTYLSPLDFLLPILALLMALDLFQRRPWARFKLPQPATILWGALAVLSYLWLKGGAETFMDWVKAAANPLVVVMLASWIFSNITDTAAEFRRLALILCASFGVCIFYAFYQYIGPVGTPATASTFSNSALGGATNIRLGGWYDNRMLFGAQAAMLIPVAAAFAALDKDPLVKAIAAVLGALALCVTMAVGGVLGAVAGIAAVAALCVLSKKYFSGFALLAGMALLAAVVFPNLPAKRNNIATLSRGLAFYAKPDPAQDAKRGTPRLRRYQAALDFLASPSDPMNEKSLPNWVLGAGAGRYNTKVNDFYDNEYYPKPGAKTDDEARFDIEQHERDGFSLFEKTAVELGAVGLLVLTFFFAAWIFGAAGAFLSGESNEIQLLALAALGAGVGALVVSVFAFPSQRGAGSGGTFAFFVALAAWLNARGASKTNISS